MYAMNVKGILVVGVLMILGLLLVVALVVMLASRNKRPPQAQSVEPHPPAPIGPEERQAILRKLADGELTKAEAERKLNQLGTPVPTAMPAPPPRSGAGKGCLIALIVALIIPLMLLALFFLSFIGVRPAPHIAPTRIEQPANPARQSVETAYPTARREAVGCAGATFPSLRSGKRSLHLAINTSSPQVFTNSHGGKS